MKIALASLPLLTACYSCSGPAADAPTEHPTIGSIERLDSALDELLSGDARIEILCDGFDWAEGPVWVKNGGYLLFTDIPPNRVFKWSEQSGCSVFLTPSGYTGSSERGGEVGANGLAIDPGGHLILCQHGDRRVARLMGALDDPRPEYETLAGRWNGLRFNSPNDLVYARDATLYFTDPPYGLERNMSDPLKEIDFQGVYRLSNDGTVTLLTSQMSRPNGIALSPDEKTLYVANSDSKRAIYMAFDLSDAGVGNGRVLFDATRWMNKRPGAPDGMAIDVHGNLWATGPGGVLVLSPAGKHLGTILTTQRTANCAFGGDGSTLYMTADMYLLRIRTKTRGLGF